MKKKLMDVYNALRDSYGPQHWWPAKTSFEVIVGAILTQNTSWLNVEKAIANLRSKALLKPNAIKRLTKERLAGMIRSSGYYNVKAERLKNFIDFLFKNYKGSLTRMFKNDYSFLRDQLLEVKGLGKETVDSILLYAGNKPVFVIDAYTRRIMSRHRMIRAESDYDEAQGLFMINLPQNVKLFNEYHALLVKLAKDNCKKTAPKCDTCPLRHLL